jgi:hypothetical protein
MYPPNELHRTPLRLSFIAQLMAVAALVAACQAAPTPPAAAQVSPQAWIDAPENMTLIPFASVNVTSHFYHPAGVTQIELSVNGAPVRTDLSPQTNTDFVYISQIWQPPTPGEYMLSVRARSTTGEWGNPASITILVGDLPTPTATETPVPPTATPTPAATSTPIPTLTPTAAPGRLVVNAQQTTLTAGQCTVLNWSSANLQSLLLNGVPVDANGSQQVCPAGTTTYALSGSTADGQQLTQSVTVAVNAPAATPSYGAINVSVTTFYNLAGCGPTGLTVSAEALNADSGMIYYRTIASGTPTAWFSAALSNAGSTWSRTIQNTDLPGDKTGTFEFYLTFSNGSGTVQTAVNSRLTFSNCKP